MDKNGSARDTASWSSQARIDAPSTGHDEDPWAGFTCPGGFAGFKSRTNSNEFKGSRIAAAGLRRLPACARISRARKGGTRDELDHSPHVHHGRGRRRRGRRRARRSRPEAGRDPAVRAPRRPQDPRPDLDDGLHHPQSRLHDLRHPVRAHGNLKLQPQMVDKYTVSKDAMKYSFTLRDGLKFHDGQPVTAEDCVASIKRWGAKDAMGRLLIASLSRMASTDRKTFVIELESPFGLVLDALGKPSASPSFIMPARLAATDPNEQVKEVMGSRPYRFVKDEWQPGNRVVYLRNPDYVPRREAPSGAAGGKRVLVDRVEWRYIPDAATASAALEAGEVDYWENVPLDFAPRLEKNANVAVFVTDPRGSQGILRPNHLQPPFNNRKARQALLWMVDQAYYLQAVIGNPKYYKVCPGIFMCGGMPYESATGAPPRPDVDKARQLLKESGYDGRPVT